MNKFLFTGLAAIAMLASCNSDEQVDMPASNNAIAFKTFVNKSTRATDLTNANISDFKVFAFMEKASGVIFSDEKVTGSNVKESGSWSYTNTQYWTPSKDYYFTAIAPADSDGQSAWSFAPLTGEEAKQGGVITFTNKGNMDLLYAFKKVTTGSTISEQDPGKVAFTFNHLLSRVKFNFKNAMGNDNTKLKITSVKITDANTKGTLDVSADPLSWALAEDNTTEEFDFGGIAAAIENNENADTAHMYFIPQNQTYTLSFVVEMYHGDVLANTFNFTGGNAVTLPQVDMKPGSSYVFSAELNGQNVDPTGALLPIVFNVETVTEWQDWGESTISFE